MLKISPLTPADIPAARRLSDQAGWNQLDADWARVIALWPDTCLAGSLDNQIVATVTLTRYAPSPAAPPANHLGWIGLMLVDSARRGAGLGGTLFDAILQLGRDRGIANFGLDATDMGRPLYAKRGLKDLCKIHRWHCPTPPAPKWHGPAIRPALATDWPALLDLDRHAVQLDRADLLRRLAAEPATHTLVAPRAAQIDGFAILRPGRVASYIGPLIARDTATAQSLLSAALAAHANAAVPPPPVFIDTPADTPLAPALAAAGFAPARTLTRMGISPAPHPMACGPQVFAIAGLELC